MIRKWVYTIRSRWIMGVCAAVCYHRIRVSHPFKAIPNIWWDYHQTVIVRSEENFNDISAGGRIWPIVVNNELDPTNDACIVERHHPMLVPALHDVPVHGRKVDLSKLAEVRIRRA
jgi:hypothetical protein